MYRLSPLYFTLLGLWTKLFGTAEFALRAFSTFLGVVAVGFTYGIGYRLFGRRTAVLGALLLATSPYFIWYAQEARYYTLTIATALMMTYSFHRAIAASSWKWWLTYTASSLLGLLSLVTVVFLIAAHGLYLLCCTSHRPMLKRWMACQIPAVVMFSTWFGVQYGPALVSAVLTKAPSVTSDELRRSPEFLPASDVAGIIPYTFYAFSVGFSFGPSLRELHVSRSISTLVSHAPTLVTAGLLFATVFALGLRKLRHNDDAGIFLVLWLGVPILATYLVATMTTFHEYNTRYVAMSLPAYILILARGIGRFRRPIIQLALLGSVLIVNGISLANYYFDSEYAREDARSAAQYLESAAQPGDIILLSGNPQALQYYYKKGMPVVQASEQSIKNTLAVSAKLPEAGNNHVRMWLVEIRPWETDPKGNVKAALDKQARLDKHQSFPGVQIYSYQSTDRGS